MAWYDERRIGLGDDLLEEVDSAVTKIMEAPELGGVVPYTDETLGVRRRWVRRFPYSVVYMVMGETIEVLAIAHAKQTPGYWRSRVELRE